jgi:hypothetical protein
MLLSSTSWQAINNKGQGFGSAPYFEVNMDIGLKDKCISCKHFCEATKECRKHAPGGSWPHTDPLMWCGDWKKSTKIELDKVQK